MTNMGLRNEQALSKAHAKWLEPPAGEEKEPFSTKSGVNEVKLSSGASRMKPYPHPGYPFKCASDDCAANVHTPGRKCIACASSEPGPIEASFYRVGLWFFDFVDSFFHRINWWKTACAVLVIATMVGLLVIASLSAVSTWRAING